MSLFSDLLGGITAGASDTEKGVAVATAFGEAVTDGRMWRSLAWILLGVAMMILGLLLWLRAPIEGAVGTVAKAVMF